IRTESGNENREVISRQLLTVVIHINGEMTALHQRLHMLLNGMDISIQTNLGQLLSSNPPAFGDALPY
uniref:hypothetical protein n=1 Tax=Endozoicomonas sp. ONNA2 TaxID=2828741 RepID=UPI00214931AE